MSFDPIRALDTRERMSRLAGLLCPLCSVHSPVLFDGRRLRCRQDHTWSNPDAAEADIVDLRPRSMDEQRRLLSERRQQEECRAREILRALECAVGPWLPPEARE